MRNTDFLDLITEFEEANLPMWDYMDLKKDMDMNHRFNKLISELEWTKQVIENAQRRYNFSKTDDGKTAERLAKRFKELFMVYIL